MVELGAALAWYRIPLSLQALWRNNDPAFLVYVRAVVERVEEAQQDQADAQRGR